MRANKRGAIDAAQPAILARLGLEGETFIEMAANLPRAFGSAVGVPAQLAHGIRTARRVFG